MNASSKKTTKKNIPNDVIVEIFSKLPAKFLLRFRWLCKNWFKVITDPYFVKMHLNNVLATNNPLVLMTPSPRICPPSTTIEFRSLNSMDDEVLLHPVHIKAPLPFTSFWVILWILGSCNGLLCISCLISSRYKIFIWNPCTKEYKRIIWGDDSVKIPDVEGTISYGFGYDCNIDDYKVIRNVFSYRDYASGYNCETLVDKYTLGTSSSKKLRNNRFILDSNNGLFVNGDLYWKGRLTRSEPFSLIVAFDIAKEEYRQIAKPPYKIHDESCHSMILGKLNGRLCVLIYSTPKPESVEFWVMKHNIVEEMNKEYSWDILYTISASPIRNCIHLQPLWFCKNGEIAMVINRTNFILYNPKDDQITFLPEVREMMPVETYIESLVPVKGGTYMDATSSISTDRPKRKVKRPLKFQDEYY